LHATQGNVLWALDSQEDALREFDHSLVLDPHVPWVLASRSGVLFELRRYIEAIDTCDAALEIENDNVDALTVKGQALNELGEYEEAIRLFARALTIVQPPLVWLQYLRGWTLENLGDASKALADYTAVIKSDPKNLWAHQGVADCLLSLGERRRARQKFRWIIRQSAQRSDMERWEVLELSGWCHYQLDEYDQAIRILEEALAIDSLQAASQFDLALAKLCGGDPKHAVVEYQRGLDIALLHEGLRAGSILQVALADLKDALHTHRRVCEFDEYRDIQQALADAREAVREKVAEARAHTAVPSDGTPSTVA
jgi:tetratricopeptide (TPR) repeat protein